MPTATFTKTASEIWRDYITDGVPASGRQKPVKYDIRVWGARLEEYVTYAYALGGLGGTRYDIAAWDPARPISGEPIANVVFTTNVTFTAALPLSRASASVAATADAVFSLTKNGTQFGTVTFAASATTGTFAAATDTSFVAGDVLSVVAPNPRDETLYSIAITITGVRT